MKKKKRKQNQVTCGCSLIPFPHRVNSTYKGKSGCDGAEWCESYIEFYGECCKSCNCKDLSDKCNVVQGSESIVMCEGYKDHLHRQPSIRLPTTLDKMIDQSTPEINEDDEEWKNYVPF